MTKALLRLFGKAWRDYPGPNGQTLEITFKLSTDTAELWVEQLRDDKQFGKLALYNGQARARVAPGRYMLLYRGRTATPHEQYDIEISAPPAGVWKPGARQRSNDAARVYGRKELAI